MKQKINIRLFIIAVIAVITTTLGITFTCYNLFQRQVQSDLKTDAEVLSESGVLQELYKNNETLDAMPDLFSDLKAESLRITWIDSDGTVLYDNDTQATTLENHLDRPEIQDAIEKGEGISIRQSDTLKTNTYYYALRLDDGTVLRVARQAKTIISVFISIFPIIALIIVFIILLCLLISHYLTRQLMEPINEMAEHLDDTIDTPVYKELIPFANKIRSQHENILEAATMRQDFTANVTHELKTPLTAICGYAELIENKMAEPNQEVYFAKQIRGNADRLLVLINDIIRLSQLDHVDSDAVFTSVNLLDEVKECCQNLKINAQRKNITLAYYGSEETVIGSKELLKELITNLIQNAIQYNNEGGKVEVYVYNDNGPALSVKDNGIGIPENVQNRVFERFYRVDKSHSKQTGGTGLGLAIVKHIAEIHNAKIVLDSEVGKGTEIKILF